MQLGSESEAQRLLVASAPPNGLKILDEVLRVRPARSTRVQSSARVDDRVTPVIGECALCGLSGHSVKDCEKRTRGVKVEFASLGEEFENGEADAAWLTVMAGVATAEAARVANGALYVTLASDADARKLVEVAIADGLEIKGEMISVESVMSTSRPSLSKVTGGLIPQVRRR